MGRLIGADDLRGTQWAETFVAHQGLSACSIPDQSPVRSTTWATTISVLERVGARRPGGHDHIGVPFQRLLDFHRADAYPAEVIDIVVAGVEVTWPSASRSPDTPLRSHRR